MRITGLDIDGEGVITFDSKYLTDEDVIFSSLNTYQDNFYNYCNAKPYIKSLRKGAAEANYDSYNSRNGAVTYTDYYVWSLSEREVNVDGFSCISVANSTPTRAECTYGVNAPYPYFTSDETRKKTVAGSSTDYRWLTRTESFNIFTLRKMKAIVSESGGIAGTESSSNIRFSPCFAIG